MKYRVNKQKCTGCQICIRNCPGATKIGADGKAEIIDQEKLEGCGGESICPFRAIEEVSGEGEEEREEETKQKPETKFIPGRGRGMGAGKGRGLGIGPRDGRGQGRGGGGRGRW